jgi:cellulose synthase (UDP-forming)
MGTLGVFKKIVAEFLRRPGALRPGQWWEYFLSGSYYFVGWANFIFIILPIAFLLFDVKPMIADARFYLAAFLPYFFLSMNTFYMTMGRRGYRVQDLFLGQALGFLSFWVLMNAAVVAMLGLKRAFGVTPKGIGGKLPLKYLWPQLTLFGLNLLATVVGVWKAVIWIDFSLVVNIFWAAYHSLLLSMVFYFNRSFTGYPDTHILKDWAEPVID